MDRENRLYYSALVLLEWAISGLDFLMDAISSDDLHNRYQQGYARFNQLAGWLTDEIFSAGDRDDIDEEHASAIHSKIEDLEPIILSWANTVQATAYSEAMKRNPAHYETITYCYGCMLVLGILNEFDQTLAGLSSQILHKRYQRGRSRISELAEWLKDEVSWFDRQESSIEKIEVVCAVGEGLVERLEADWRDSVHAFARQINADQ